MEPKEVFEMEKTYIYKSSFATKIKKNLKLYSQIVTEV